MSIGQRFRLVNLCSIIFIVCLAATIVLAAWNQRSLNLAQEIRFESHLRANELMMSSEDLTRLARTYVVTGDPKYEAMYWSILDVRNGKKPRPDGRTVALTSLMKDLGFTEDEFAKLKEAERNSNDLVKTETIAMNAVKGLFDDGNGGFTRKAEPDRSMAVRIMHDDAYHKNKEIIMKPISDFESMLNARTEASVRHYVNMGNTLLGIIAVLSLLTAGSLFLMTRSVRGVLTQIVGKLHAATDQSARLTGDLLANAKKLSDATSEQAAAAQETAATLDEINAMVAKSEDNARRSSDSAETGRETATEGRSSVDSMVAAISDIDRGNKGFIKQVEEGNRQLNEILAVINGIGEKTKVINDIVFQTKLLSFNASVEAARAGEHGKGFAVVAEEIGNLANMSGSSAREITEMLDGGIRKVEAIVQETTNRISSLVKESNSKVEHGNRLAEKCGVSLTKVVQVSDEVKSMVDEISRAASEQAKGVSAITQAVSNINGAIQQNARSAELTSSLAESLNSSSRELMDLVETIEVELLSQKKAA